MIPGAIIDVNNNDLVRIVWHDDISSALDESLDQGITASATANAQAATNIVMMSSTCANQCNVSYAHHLCC
jgi:hypothetical protein